MTNKNACCRTTAGIIHIGLIFSGLSVSGEKRLSGKFHDEGVSGRNTGVIGETHGLSGDYITAGTESSGDFGITRPVQAGLLVGVVDEHEDQVGVIVSEICVGVILRDEVHRPAAVDYLFAFAPVEKGTDV